MEARGAGFGCKLWSLVGILPAVGGCYAHVWGGSSGERKPSWPAGAAEMATEGAVVDAVVRHKFVGSGTVGIEVLRLCP